MTLNVYNTFNNYLFSKISAKILRGETPMFVECQHISHEPTSMYCIISEMYFIYKQTSIRSVSAGLQNSDIQHSTRIYVFKIGQTLKSLSYGETMLKSLVSVGLQNSDIQHSTTTFLK